MANQAAFPTKVPLAPDRYDRTDQDRTRKLIELALVQLSHLTNSSSVLLKGTLPFANITDTPTTLAGYGITDAYTKTQVDALIAGIVPPVTSVFGRTGAVVATEGDYSLTLLSDVTISSPSNGQFVVRRSGTFINDTIAAADVPNLDASKITTGTMATARLGSGTANSTTFLRGDSTWASVSTTFAALTDVNLSGLANLDLLQYQTSDSKWHNVTGISAAKITSGTLALARGGTNVDLSASGGATKILAQDGSQVISARDLVAADIPNLDAAKITTGVFAEARGGTNQSTYTTGDLLYASATNTLSKLGIGSNNKILQVVSGLPAWVTPTSGGGGTFSYYDADAPSSSPTSQDDSFDANSLDVKWTQVNWTNLSYDTNTTKPGALYVTITNASTTTDRALLQSLPAGDFTIQVWCQGSTKVAGTATYMGLVLSTSSSAGAGTQYIAALVETGAGWTRFAQTRTNFNAASSTQYGGDPWLDQGGFVRIRRTGTSVFAGFSADGRTWFDTAAATWTSISPTHMGLFVQNNSPNLPVASFMHFRYAGSNNFLFGNTRTVVGS